MIHKRQKYPGDLNELLVQANNIADCIFDKLQKNDCPTINDLYIKVKRTYANGCRHIISRNKELFNAQGYDPNIQAANSKSLNEFKGLYVFGELGSHSIHPVYVGISRSVYRRLKQHGYGTLHNECTLAYLLASDKDKSITRSTSDHIILKPQKEIVRNFKVALYPVDNDYELYFYEVVLAGIFKTKWNSFRTH